MTVEEKIAAAQAEFLANGAAERPEPDPTPSQVMAEIIEKEGENA